MNVLTLKTIRDEHSYKVLFNGSTVGYIESQASFDDDAEYNNDYLVTFVNMKAENTICESFDQALELFELTFCGKFKD